MRPQCRNRPGRRPRRWPNSASAPASAEPWRVVILHAARDQLRGASPLLLGYVDGILAVLRVDPEAATAAFDVRILDDEYREAIFAAATARSGSGCSGISRLSP